MIQTLLAEYNDAYRRKSPDHMADLYSESGTLKDIMGRVYVSGSSGIFRGRGEIVLYYRGLFKLHPHNPVPTSVEIVHKNAQAVVEMTIERFRTCHVLEVRNDKIVEHNIYLGNLPNRYLFEKLLNLYE